MSPRGGVLLFRSLPAVFTCSPKNRPTCDAKTPDFASIQQSGGRRSHPIDGERGTGAKLELSKKRAAG
jgi:hypothetical protein